MAKKGEIVVRGGKRIISDGKGGGRVVRAADDARTKAKAKIKRETVSGKAPPIPQPIGGPTTQKELNVARKKAAARKKKRVESQPRPDAIQNQPTTTGIRKAFEQAAEGRKKAEEALQRKK